MQHIEKSGDNIKNTDRPRSVYIATIGCQMNVRDTEVICGLLEKEGYKITDEPQEADIILFNTCSVRQHAEDKVWSEIGRISKLCSPRFRAEGTRNLNGGTPRPTKKIVGLVGCMAQNYKEAVFERSSNVDFAVGPSDIAKIPQILNRLIDEKKKNKTGLLELKIWETGSENRPEEIYHTDFHQEKDHTYVVISEGCSNYCSYCVVPYVRGDLRHRHHKDILKEIEKGIAAGITKITLLGQNVNAYKDDSVDFVRLLELVNSINGLKDLSFITSHPKDASLELFKAMQDLEKVKKYLHLPIQSGSDRILKLMNRGYSGKYYFDLIESYRKIVKGAVLTTDIIVGFPGEAEKDFQETYDLVKDAEFNAAFIFKYSTRPHTAAASMEDSVPKEEKERRHRLILDLQKEISKRKNECKI